MPVRGDAPVAGQAAQGLCLAVHPRRHSAGLFARAEGGRGAPTIMRDGTQTDGPGLLAPVADPVRQRGRVFRQSDLPVVDAPLSGARRS